MKNAKTTKRALFASMMSMLLCVAMLIGTTFAWFTDSVTTGKNTIVAGNLDVELYSRNAEGEYNPVSADETLFDNEALWEPGHTEVVYLKVANLGTLALKYKLAVTVEKETKGKNGAGETFELSDYLVFGQATGTEETIYETREDAWTAVGSTLGLNEYTDEDILTPDTEKFIALVVYMPTTVGNEANYTGTSVPKIELGINLLATQTPYEKDSFDENYDAEAPINFKYVSSYNDVYGKLEDGRTFYVESDVIGLSSKSSAFYFNKCDTELALCGKTINAPVKANPSTANIAAISISGVTTKLTITGDGTVDGGSGAKTNVAVKVSNGAAVVIKGGTYTTGADVNGNGDSVILVNEGSAEIYGGFFYTDVKYGEQYWVLNCQDGTDSTIKVYGGTFVNFDPSNNLSEGEGTNFVADGYKVVSEAQSNGDVWYTVVPE